MELWDCIDSWVDRVNVSGGGENVTNVGTRPNVVELPGIHEN